MFLGFSFVPDQSSAAPPLEASAAGPSVSPFEVVPRFTSYERMLRCWGNSCVYADCSGCHDTVSTRDDSQEFRHTPG